MPPIPMDGNHHNIEGEEEEHHYEDGFVDDDSSSLPPDYFDPNKKGDDHFKKSSEQSEQGTAPTAAMTSSLAASTTSFSFEITLPPPSDISPLSCRESVVTAMMARPLDRALEQQRIPQRPLYDEYSGGGHSPSERRRSSYHRRSHHHRKSVDDGHGEDRRSERSRSIHAKSRRDLGNTSALSETSEDKKAVDEQQRRRRSRSEKPKSSGRCKSTDGKRLSSSRSKSRDISSDEQKRRHRSKSRSAREGDRTSDGRRRQESSRKLFTIAAIKEEVEEAIVVESPRKTKDPTEKDSQPRQRSRSRQRSPSSRNNRSPSSSHRHKNGNSRSKSRNRGPSKSGNRANSQKPTGSSRDRSKSKTRHRSRSRSHSRTREKTTEQEAKEYLAVLSGLQSAASEDSTQDKTSTPSFLSRLAESHDTKSNDGGKRQSSAAADKETLMKPKSVRWGAFDDAFASDTPTKKAPMAAVQEEYEEDSRLKVSPEKLPRQDEKSRRHRSRSKSQSGRHRSKSRRRREAEEEKTKKPESQRKMKWDELVNASKSNFQFSNDSFCFDQKDEPKTPSPLKTIQPKITPVVLRGGLGSPTSFPKIEMDGEEVATSQSITRPTAFPSPTPSVSSISDSQVRLETANALILEKRRRKEASKARQVELNSMKFPLSAMDMSDNFEFCFPKTPFDMVQGGSQFSPALRVSNMAISPQRRVEHAKFPLSEWDTKCKVALSTPPSHRDELKKKMSELAAKSKRPQLPDESKPEEANEPLTHSEQTQAQTARISRKERAEARRAKRRQKIGESSSDLSNKAEEIQKPESFRESLEKLEEISEKQQEGGLQQKASIPRSKWAGMKGSIHFISKMKLKATELESND